MLRGQPPESLAELAPLLQSFVKFWAPAGTLIVALLMVSRISYPHLTKQFLRGRRTFSYLVRVVLAVFLIVLLQDLALVVVFWGYALVFLGRHAYHRALSEWRARTTASDLDEPVSQ